jgi:hypothetical protein
VLQVPAALSPASHFDELPKIDPTGQPGKPLAEEVKGSLMGASLHDIGVGSGSKEGAVDLGPPSGGTFAGPPSIKAPVPPPQPAPPQLERRPPPAPPAPPAQPPQQQYRTRPLHPASPDPKWLPSGDENAWRKVRGGLGMIRLALLLQALMFLAAFGHGLWIAFDYERALSSDPGLLKQADWPLWKETLVAYTGGLAIPTILLLLFGRLRCASAPPEAHARSLALGAVFFTLVAILAAALIIGMRFFDLSEKIKFQIPPQADLTAQYVLVPAVLLAEILTLLYVGQIGWPLSRPPLQKSVAGFFVYAALLPAGVLIGMQYYPVIGPVQRSLDQTGAPLGTAEDDVAQRVLIWAVVVLAAGVLFFLRYAAVVGRARLAIRKLLAGEP